MFGDYIVQINIQGQFMKTQNYSSTKQQASHTAFEASVNIVFINSNSANREVLVNIVQYIHSPNKLAFGLQQGRDVGHFED